MAYEQTNSQGMNVYIERSHRRTTVLSVSPRAEVILKVPYETSKEEINRILTENSSWIHTRVERILRARENAETVQPFTKEELRELTCEAAEYIPMRVAFYAERLHVSYGRITIRHQRTRWGSCSMKGNLNFNCLLMKAPPEVLDYVVVHELCHRREMNHSSNFWALVEAVLPDYQTQKTWLREHGDVLVGRLEAE